MFFPRSGPNTESWTKAEQVWCSTNRNEALTRAKLGEDLKSPKACGNSPVGRDYALGKKFDIRGTPAIVMNNGEMLGGYCRRWSSPSTWRASKAVYLSRSLSLSGLPSSPWHPAVPPFFR